MESTGIHAAQAEPGPAFSAAKRRAENRTQGILKAEAFGALYREYYGAIAGLIYRRTGDAHVTEDLTNDVFVAAFGSLNAYRGEVPVLAWLRAIAQNRVNRWARREAGLRGILRRVPIVREFVPVPQAKSERMRALDAMLRLPVRQQEVLSSHYLEGMTLEEIGSMLGVTAEVVKSRLARAREALRRELRRGESAKRSDREQTP